MNYKSFISLIIIVCISLSSIAAFGTDNPAYTEKALKTYGLLVSLGIINNDEKISFESVVSIEIFSKLYEAYFSEIPDTSFEKLLNVDAVNMLTNHLENPDISAQHITSYKDFGLIDLKYRDAYKIACNAGMIEPEREFLKPYDELTYEELFYMLAQFDSDIAQNCGIELISGKVSDATSLNNIITISVASDKKTEEVSFKRTDSFSLCKDLTIEPYNYNIKRNDYVIFYVKEGKIIYAVCKSPVNEYRNEILNSGSYSVFKSTIYLYLPSANQIILKDIKKGTYTSLNIKDSTLIYRGSEQKSLSDINILYLDIDCYFIIDTSTNTIKYINIAN